MVLQKVCVYRRVAEPLRHLALQPVKNSTPSSTCTRFCRFAIFARFRNHSCSFLQRKIPYRGTDFHIQNCAAHDRSALRNRESAIAAPLFRQLPQWSNLLRHDTLRMTKFVCSAVPLPSAGSTHPQAAGPACKEENHVSPAAPPRSSTQVWPACMRAASAAAQARSTACCTA